MKDFNYYTPTEVEFGVDAESKLIPLINKYAPSGKILIHYGGGSIIKSGLLQRIKCQLNDANIEYIELGGVQPNPRLALVRKGVDLCKRENIALILAVGGGSVIDSSKAIGYGYYYDGDVWDIFIGKYIPTDTLPVGCVLTIAAAGSEMSDCSVISNDDTQQKLGYSNNIARAKFAIMNPILTYTLPVYQKACGAVDIMMHTMERYFTKDSDMMIQTSLAEALLRCVKDAADMILVRKDISESERLQAHSALMWASSLSHNDLMGSRFIADFATHKIEHELSALFDVAHGAGLSAIWSSWARFVMHCDYHRFAQFATNVMGVERCSDDESTAERGIAEIERLYRSWGMPVGLKELLSKPASEEQIKLMASKCTKGGTFRPGNFCSLSEEDVVKILTMANEL